MPLPHPADPAVEESASPLTIAGGGKRFGNFVIDLLCYLLFSRLLQRGLERIGWLSGWDKFASDGNMLVVVEAAFYALLIYILYFSVFETITGGKTIGKYFTRTRAVNKDGTRISGGKALGRAVVRSIPFEPLSAPVYAPPYPWHDRWTGTIVVDETEKNRRRTQ